MSLVSVIIPYFKKKKFIKETINSVIKQTYTNIEIIIIYDDSDINDLEYIEDIIKIDKRIQLYVNKFSLGAGKSRNLGIKKSKGSYIAFIDADDLWEINKLEFQIKFMQNNRYLITHTSYQIIDINRNILSVRVARDFNNINDLLKSCDIGLSSVMIKREVLDENCMFPELKTKEDFVLWLIILKKNIQIKSINKNLMFWRKLNSSLSSSTVQKLIDGYRVYNSFMKFNFLKSIYLLICLSLNFLKKR
tara:strand:- start:5007 stop:5750 length:744 start_codon:yes stop_codon:yes gene_type:complete